jgi:hypothetical protein
MSLRVGDGTVLLKMELVISEARSLKTSDMCEDVLMRFYSEVKSVHRWKIETRSSTGSCESGSIVMVFLLAGEAGANTSPYRLTSLTVLGMMVSRRQLEPSNGDQSPQE